MNWENTREFLLEGLDCAHCGSQIEDGIKELPEVTSSAVNFMMKTLIVEFKDKKNIENINKTIEDIVINIDSNVILKEKQEKSESVEEYKWYKDKKNLVLLIGSVLFAVPMLFGESLNQSLTFILFLAAYIIIGGDVVAIAFKNIFKGQVFDENFLMTIATIGAFLIGQYPEGVAVMLFYKVGELFQDIAVNRSRRSIADLMDIRPDFANVKEGNETKRVAPESVNIGDIIVIRPGEKIPLDGVVISGTSMVDTSAITGESMPRDLNVGGEALSGFINQTGLLEVEVKKEFGESTVSKILELVQNASNRKAKTENFITKFARVYTPLVVIIASLIAIVPPVFVSGALFSDWVYRALVFLVVSCPCALVISIPLGFFGGIGAASKNGILIKGSNYLEALNHIDTLVFDKTGTLTKGEFSVTSIKPAKGFTKDQVLEYAAYTESYSTHPIAKSIISYYGKQVDNTNIKDYKEVAGKGIEATINGEKVLAGNESLMKRNNIKDYAKNGHIIGTIIYVAAGNKYAGMIVIADTIKEDAKDAIKQLKKYGIKETIMLTGDHENVAKDVADKLGIDKFYADLLPQDKVKKLEELYQGRGQGKTIGVVGDGINDAPILARADIGIAMGGMGSDAAIEEADVVIMTDEPSKISTAIRIAKKTQTVVVQNIVFALGVKFIILLLGAMGIATMWGAVFADVGVSVIAIVNAMRVMRAK